MVDIDSFSIRVAKALGLTTDQVRSVAKSILEADLNVTCESKLKKLLTETGIGETWNHVLDRKRSNYIAHKIRELIPEQNPIILDVFSGTGTVATSLRELGCQVIETERISHYPAREDINHIIDFDTDYERIETVTADVAIIITSMHHEAKLDKFIATMSRLRNVKRFIVIENLRTKETDYELHQRMDWFFNFCLNDFDADCPGWYWDQQQWEIILSSLGEVRWIYSMDDVPGVPFTYDLFEITRTPFQIVV